MPLDANRRKEEYRLVPEGALVTRAWLQSHDLSGHAIDNLIKSKQLPSLKNGVYKCEGSSVAWGDVVYFLQRNDATDLTIGSITALQLLKLSHYLSFSDKRVVQLYGQDPLPTWINRVTDDSFFQKGNASDLLGRAADPFLAK